MAMGQSGRTRAGNSESIEDWMRRRSADVQRLGHDAELAGREGWHRATRTGEALAATRPADVAALGAHALEQATSAAKQHAVARSASRVQAPMRSPHRAQSIESQIGGTRE